MSDSDQKAHLNSVLQTGREALLWKLEGLSEYDMRRPLVPTGTNLLGLVKHVAGTEGEYLGAVFGRPFAGGFPWMTNDAVANVDMWATAGESSAELIDLYRRVWAHSDETVAELALNAPGVVPWWPEETRNVTLQEILVHMIAETFRHAGHADIVRELIDGTVGRSASRSNLPDEDEQWWADYREQLETEARTFVTD